MNQQQTDDIRARLADWKGNGWIYRANASFMPKDIAALLSALDEQAARFEAAREIIDDLLTLPLDAGYWKDVYIGSLAKRLEVTYGPSEWSRVMDDVARARAWLKGGDQ